MFLDHGLLKYLLMKMDTQKRLVWFILLLQEFDIEIEDKKWSKDLVVDHLSRIIQEDEFLPILEQFLDEQLFSLKGSPPLYDGLVNYLLTKKIPYELPRA